MSNQINKTKVLITVMTYPHPSKKHREVVCTAGITENYQWVRLYPIEYRYTPKKQQFHKYQWIEVELSPRDARNDSRKESRKPISWILGNRLSSKNDWRERREIIDKMPVYTVNQLKQLYKMEKASLGIVRPTQVLNVKVEPAEPHWKPEWQVLFDQLTLFGPVQKDLRKIPYKFSYVFECEDGSKHESMIIDWELGVLWLKEVNRLGDQEQAASSVKFKFLNEMCSDTKDTLFFMGTTFPFNSWIVLGVFWPPKPKQVKPQATQKNLFE